METSSTTANGVSTSVIAIKNLIDDFNLGKADGSAEFEAEVDFLVKGKRNVSQSRVRIRCFRDSYIISLLNRAFNPKLMPVEFQSSLQTFIYFVNEYLFIAGFNPNATIGSYTISITPKAI
jgi:hypothetical protein